MMAGNIPEELQKRYLMVELSCAERKCNPCTYPNCQRFEREVSKKKSFKMKVVELTDAGIGRESSLEKSNAATQEVRG